MLLAAVLCALTLDPPVVLESFPHVPLDTGPAPMLPAFEPRGGLVQANVDALGADIPGDAANEPSVATDPRARNRMVIAWRQFDTVASNFRQAGYAWSIDGGLSWHKETLDPGVFRSDPVLRAGDDGTIYWSTLFVDGGTYRGDFYRSTDGGRTWEGPFFAYGGDKIWIAVDRSNGAWPGNVYQHWNTAGNPYFPNQFNLSADRAATWSPPMELPSVRPVFGTCAIGPDRELYIVGQRNSTNTPTFYVVKSTDAHLPGSTPTFTSLTPNGLPMGGNMRLGVGPNPAGLLGQCQVVVDTSNGPRRGWVYVLSSADPTGDDPMNIYFRRSTDGGVTWDPLVQLNTDPPLANSWQWFGTIGVAPNGRLDVVYNDTSHTLDTRLSRLVYTTSPDGGVTWTAPQAMTPTFDTFLGWPQQNKIGDYYDIESDLLGAHVAFSATFTGGQDVYYLRIGPRDCNGNGVDDATDVLVPGADCDGNGIPDGCEIAAGAVPDANHNGVPDICEGCDPDVNCDGVPDQGDVACIILAVAGDPSCFCQADPDFNGDGVPDQGDVADVILTVAGAPCP